MSKSLRVLGLSVASCMSLWAVGNDNTDVYRFDIGAGLGMSGYLGEANSSYLCQHPGLAGYVSGRYIFNERTALRAQLGLAGLSGNSADLDNVLPGMASYSFNALATSFDVRGEFNFLPYGIGETYRRLNRITPYMAAGVGVTMSSCDGKTAAAFSIPLAFGVKYKPAKRVNITAEFAMVKVFGDKLDGETLDDLYGIESSFIKNTDWYSTLTVGVSYEFGPRCVACNRLD